MAQRVNLQSFDIPIIGASNNVAQDDPEYTLNFYSEKVSDEVYTLKPTPGTVRYGQFKVTGGGRGLIEVAGRLFGVRGGFFQEMIAGVATVRGGLLSTEGRVAMVSVHPPPSSVGPTQILIVDDAHGYVFDLGANTFTLLTVGDGFVGGGSGAAYCAGRAFVFKPGTNQFQCSGLYDFTTWNGLAFKTAQSFSTPINALVANGDRLYVFSTGSFEMWQDDGTIPIPVTRILAGDRIGCKAPGSALVSERYVYWLAGNTEGFGVVYRHEGGGAPERISDHSTERNIAVMPDPENATAFAYQSLGHVFYVLNFREGNRTFCFDAITNGWADRGQREPVSGNLLSLPFISSVVFSNLLLGLDYRDGTVDKISNEIFTDRGQPIIRDRITAVFPKEADFLTFFSSVELFGEWGR